MSDFINDKEDLTQQLVLETSQIAWGELQYFFAKGMAIYVSDELDLVEVAKHIVEDNKTVIENLMDQGKISHVNNDQARKWHTAKTLVWAVVVKPWVLVQESSHKSDANTLN